MGYRAPQAPSTGTWLGVPSARSLGVVAQEVRMPAVVDVSPVLPRSSASARCSVSGVSVQCPRVPVHATGVRCGRLSVQVSGVRRPVWASGVRAFPRPLCPTEARSWSAAVGQAAARLGWPGSAWSPAASRSGSSSARVGAWRSKLVQAVLGQRRRRLGPGCRPGRLGSGQVDRVAYPDRPDAGADLPPVGSQWAARFTILGQAARHVTSAIVAQSPPRTVHLPRRPDSPSDPATKAQRGEPAS
jgi:hypothetical protein